MVTTLQTAEALDLERSWEAITISASKVHVTYVLSSEGVRNAPCWCLYKSMCCVCITYNATNQLHTCEGVHQYGLLYNGSLKDRKPARLSVFALVKSNMADLSFVFPTLPEILFTHSLRHR